MVGIAPEVWFPIITLGIGAAATAFFQKLSDTRQLGREREARHEQRREAASLRRIEFQRATLLELQDRLVDLGRMLVMAHHEDIRSSKTTGKWRNLLSDEVDEGLRVAMGSVSKLLQRVRDDKTRELIGAFRSAGGDITLAQSREASEHHLNVLLRSSEDLNARLGVVLRALDDDEDEIVQRS